MAESRGTDSQGIFSEVWGTSENLSNYVVGTFLLVKTQLKGSWFVKSFVFNAWFFFQFSRTFISHLVVEQVLFLANTLISYTYILYTYYLQLYCGL